MRNDLRSSILWLGPNQLLELRDAQGRVLTTVIGTLWITQQDDPRDLVIGPGESRRIERNGITLAQSLNGAAYVLVEDGVAARLIHADGSSEIVAHGRPETASRVATLPVDLDSANLHARARRERNRAIATAFAAAIDAVRSGVSRGAHRAGRRLTALLPPAVAALVR